MGLWLGTYWWINMENINKETSQNSQLTDFYAWTQKTSQLLSDGNYHKVDMQMEEIPIKKR